MPNDTQEQVQDVPDWIRAGDLPNLDLFVTPDDLDSMQADIRKVEQGLALMRQYAEAKANAMRCRLNGAIPLAVRFEAACDHVYMQMPEWARW